MRRHSVFLSRAQVLSDWLVLRGFAPLLVGAVVYTFLRSHHCSLGSAQCIDSYWLDHWLIGYESGLTRRGLLGWLHRLFAGEMLDVAALHLFSFFLVYVIFFYFSRGLLGLTGAERRMKILVLVAASPVLGVFFETLGDPLHLCIVLFALACVAAVALPTTWCKALVIVFSILVSALIHEASLLLMAPAFLFLAQARVASTVSIKRPLLLAALCFGVVALASAVLSLAGGVASWQGAPPAEGSVQAFNVFTGKTYGYSGVQASGFYSLLLAEYNTNFRAFGAMAAFAFRPFTAGLIPIAFLFLIAALCRSRALSALLLKGWLFAAICSFPLYVVAHDWGRFAVYNLVVAVLMAAAFAPSVDCSTDAVPPFGAWGNASDVAVKSLVALMIALAAYPMHPAYRISGIPLRGLLIVALAITGFLLVRASLHRRGAD